MHRKGTVAYINVGNINFGRPTLAICSDGLPNHIIVLQ